MRLTGQKSTNPPASPGGCVEKGESPRQAAARELLEESGQESDGPLRFIGYAGFVLAPDLS
ncbi:NUDIX domain-containing protein [Streptomyces sp. NBC_00258]